MTQQELETITKSEADELFLDDISSDIKYFGFGSLYGISAGVTMMVHSSVAHFNSPKYIPLFSCGTGALLISIGAQLKLAYNIFHKTKSYLENPENYVNMYSKTLGGEE